MSSLLLPPIVPCTGSPPPPVHADCTDVCLPSQARELRKGEAPWLLGAARTLSTVTGVVWWMVSLKHSPKGSPLASCLRVPAESTHALPGGGAVDTVHLIVCLLYKA